MHKSEADINIFSNIKVIPEPFYLYLTSLLISTEISIATVYVLFGGHKTLSKAKTNLKKVSSNHITL